MHAGSELRFPVSFAQPSARHQQARASNLFFRPVLYVESYALYLFCTKPVLRSSFSRASLDRDRTMARKHNFESSRTRRLAPKGNSSACPPQCLRAFAGTLRAFLIDTLAIRNRPNLLKTNDGGTF
jgi:hypothetical protein